MRINIVYVILKNKSVRMVITICFRCAFVLFNSKPNLKACHFGSQAKSSSTTKYVYP